MDHSVNTRRKGTTSTGFQLENSSEPRLEMWMHHQKNEGVDTIGILEQHLKKISLSKG